MKAFPPKARILLIEDEKNTADALAPRLSGLGYPLCGRTSSIENARTMAEERRPDLAILCLSLKGGPPDESFFENMAHTLGVPVVFALPDQDVSFFDGPAYCLVRTPWHDGAIETAIESALHVFKLTEKNREHQADLKTRLSRMEAVFQASRDAVVFLDPEGLISEVNPAFEKYFGWSGEELYRQPLDVIVPEKERNNLQEAPRPLELGETIRFEAKRKTRDGRLLNLQASLIQVMDQSDQVTGSFEVYHDIREQVRTERIKKALFAISRSVYGSTSLDELYRSIRESLSCIIDTTNFYISRYDGVTDTVTCPYFVDEREASFPLSGPLNPASLHAMIIKTRLPLLLTEEEILAMAAAGEITFPQTPAKCWLGVPLIVKDQVIGVLAVRSYTSSRKFTVHDVELLESITHQIAVAIERKQAEERLKESEGKYRTIFEQSRDAIYITSPRGEPIAFNQATLDFFGYSLEELSQVKVEDIYIDPDGRARNNALLERQGFIKDCEVHLRRKDGREIICLDTATIWKEDDGRIKGYIGTLRDITELRRTEEALRRAKEEAEAATRSKSEFLANMSHEIRSPMNAIIGLTHLALKTGLTSKQRDYLTKVQSSANNLLDLINDILDFSKIEAGRLRMETTPFHFDEVMSNLRNIASIKAEEKRLELIFSVGKDVPRVLVGDPLRLGQVLLNLTTNALKFTDSGHVMVRAERLPDPRDGDSNQVVMKFSVQDTGIGLTPDQLGKLFRAFSQADTSTTRKFGGTGLGLAISRTLVEMMGGEISAQSVPGQGSTFWFTARFGLETDIQEKLLLFPEELRGMKVLIVDDNPMAREIICEALETFSFRTAQVSSGKEAIAELEKEAHSGHPYELVIMDWRMEGMNGIEASRQIKFSSELARIPSILMVTAYGKEEVIKEAQKAGIDGYLVKPVDRGLLFDTIMTVLGISAGNESNGGTSAPLAVDGLDGIRGARILLVEDMEINQQVATELLEEAGFVVEVANNGKEAVEKFTFAAQDVQTLYDAILMDIQMPVMDGYTATAKIRGHGQDGQDMPIIAMTAYAMSGEREKCIASGMNDHVSKPIDPGNLYATLVRWIRPGEREAAASASRSRVRVEVDLPPNLPGIDMGSGLGRVAGNKALYLDLLLKFKRKHGRMDREIQEAVTARDFGTARNLTHMLKGIAGNLGARFLQEWSSGLERALDASDQDGIHAHLQGLAESLLQVIKGLEGIREPGNIPAAEGTESEPEVDKEKVARLLTELHELISSDYGAALDSIRSMKGMFGQTQVGGTMDQIERCLEEFNEEDALTHLKAVALAFDITLGGPRS